MRITIQTTADFTPPGKRRAKIAYGNRIRWYVSGEIYRTLKITAANVALSKEWVEAARLPNPIPARIREEMWSG